MTGILLVDKPQDWTSSDVVAKLRGVLHERRIGHAGTLDPLATGLLVVLLGRATRASDYVMAHDKEYDAVLRLGITTDTQDITGSVLKETPCRVAPEELSEAISGFTGDIEQIPPMYSAIKVHGKKLYEIARKGGEIERAPRKITVSNITVTGREENDIRMHITCSSGTYIRTLCNDIGNALGCGGCMAALRRTRVGSSSIDGAHTLEEIIQLAKTGAAEKLLIPVDSVFSMYPSCTVPQDAESKLRNGNIISSALPDGTFRVYSESGEFLMLGSAENGELKTVKSFFEV